LAQSDRDGQQPSLVFTDEDLDALFSSRLNAQLLALSKDGFLNPRHSLLETEPNLPIAPDLVAPRTANGLFTRKTGALAGAAIAVVAGTSLIQSTSHPADYTGKTQLLVEPPTNSQPSARSAATQVKPAAPSIDYATQVQILWSPKLLSPVVKHLQSQYPDLNYDRLAQNLEITHEDGAKTLEISYRDTDPQKVQVVLKQVTQAYLQYSQICQTKACRALQFVEQRLPQVQRQVQLVQQKLAQFQQHYGTNNPDQLGKQLLQRRDGLAQRQSQLNIQAAEVSSRYAVLQRQLGLAADNAGANPLLQQNAHYNQLLQQLQSDADRLATELAHPQADPKTIQILQQRYQQDVVQLSQAAQETVLRSSLGQHSQSQPDDEPAKIRVRTLLQWVDAAHQMHTIQITQRAIAQAEKLLSIQVQQWAVLARQYSEIQQELEAATGTLALYQTRQADFKAQIEPPVSWKVISPPVMQFASH
jgi:uncharacterized protein involved in exopolysaccharide biosynthesis